MIYELGHLALILALTMALSQSVLPLIGAQTGNAAWMALARPSARGQFLFLLIAYGCLTHAFITNDFSVAIRADEPAGSPARIVMEWLTGEAGRQAVLDAGYVATGK